MTPEERFSRANDAIVAQRYNDAVKEFNTLLRDLRGDDRQTVKNRRKALYRLGRLQYLFLNRPDLALDCFKQVVAIDPRAPLSFNALASMGRIYHDTMRDMAQAVLAYQTLLAYFPKHRHADRYHHRLIDAYFNQGNFSQVRAEGMAAINALPKSPHADDILYLVAEAALLEGDKKGAEKAFVMLVQRYPGGEWSGQSHYELGGIFEERGEFAAALSHYEKAAPALGGSPAVQRKIEALKKKPDLHNSAE
ncbi:MAG: tetratricopeptide repeat protein [Deltaproteobacteria bacterium]|nr:tetratricopeptide repeat protein [Deltaproteobacteria bacterium]